MGMKFKGCKRVSIPVQCRWCAQILVGSAWVQERRTIYGGRYCHGICPSCRAPYFQDSPSGVEAMTPDPTA